MFINFNFCLYCASVVLLDTTKEATLEWTRYPYGPQAQTPGVSLLVKIVFTFFSFSLTLRNLFSFHLSSSCSEFSYQTLTNRVGAEVGGGVVHELRQGHQLAQLCGVRCCISGR